MSYNYSSGTPTVTGDLKAKDDTQRDTIIDFGEDQIDFQTSGSVRLQITNDSVRAVNVPFSGTLNGSANAAENDIMGTKLIGGVFEIDQGLFQNPSVNPVYFPSDDTFLERAGPSSVNYFMAPFYGELIKVQIKSSTSFSGTSLTCSFHTGSGTNNAYSSTPAVSVALNGQAANQVYTFDFMNMTGSTFAEGDIYGFSLEVAGGFAGNENIHFTTTVRYNPYYDPGP